MYYYVAEPKGTLQVRDGKLYSGQQECIRVTRHRDLALAIVGIPPHSNLDMGILGGDRAFLLERAPGVIEELLGNHTGEVLELYRVSPPNLAPEAQGLGESILLIPITNKGLSLAAIEMIANPITELLHSGVLNVISHDTLLHAIAPLLQHRLLPE